MLVCNISLRAPRAAISVDIVEAATAVDATATGNVIFATLVDAPANVRDVVDAFTGEIMLEAANAAATVTAGVVYGMAVLEEATASAVTDGAKAPSAITAAVDETATAAEVVDAATVSAPTRSAMLPRAMIGPSASREAYVAGTMVNLSEDATTTPIAADVAEATTAVDSPSATIAGRWVLVGSWTYSTPVANVDFTGLAGYTEVRAVMRQVSGSSGLFQFARVSTNNGSSFMSSAGDYIETATDGTANTITYMPMQPAIGAGAHTGEILITGWNLTANKVAQMRHATGIRQYVIPTSSALNALRIADNGGDLTGGSIYVFAR
jgi:hypothetical protein